MKEKERSQPPEKHNNGRNPWLSLILIIYKLSAIGSEGSKVPTSNVRKIERFHFIQ